MTSKVDKRKRYQFLLEQKRRYEDRLLEARKTMGQGIWHEDSSYEFAEQNIKLYKSYLEEITSEIETLQKELKIKR